MNNATVFLKKINSDYARLHQAYEQYFWTSYMGDHSVDEKKNKAQQALDTFRGNQDLKTQALELLGKANEATSARLQTWIDFFDTYQVSDEAQQIKNEIDELESRIMQRMTSRREGYIDPVSKKFVEASALKMRTLIQTHPDEKIRKACFKAREELAKENVAEYVQLVKLRNKFAHTLGYDDFYDYILRKLERTSKDEVFSLFADIAEKTKGTFEQVRELEKTEKGLRKPWNFGYKMAGDFTSEEDKYFQFDEAVLRWGRSFSALGIDFKDGALTLDLLDRKGKYSNGFCHWPQLVNYNEGKRTPGAANFTCTVVPGQVGSGVAGYNTLFHEGGHAAHLLNTTQKDVCLNHEYAPMTSAWAETHSMFLDTVFSSIEWKVRYAKDVDGVAYPLELFKRIKEKLYPIKPRQMLSIVFVSTFEKEVYELDTPTAAKIIAIAKKTHREYTDLDGDSLAALNIPHIYSWGNSCIYHGYGLAEIALTQWRDYFYKKYGYIVDNKAVGKEMRETWKRGGGKSFSEAMKLATGTKLSSKHLIKELTMTPKQTFLQAKKRLTRMETIKEHTKPINLKASITLVHGKKEIANNNKGFESMAQKYAVWVRKMAASQS